MNTAETRSQRTLFTCPIPTGNMLARIGENSLGSLGWGRGVAIKGPWWQQGNRASGLESIWSIPALRRFCFCLFARRGKAGAGALNPLASDQSHGSKWWGTPSRRGGERHGEAVFLWVWISCWVGKVCSDILKYLICRESRLRKL